MMAGTEMHRDQEILAAGEARDGFAGPRVVPIPAGWFVMGSAAGRDDEKPEHRVWVDAIEMATCQVARAEYARFLDETARAVLPFWEDANFQDARQPVVGPSWFDAVAYCEWLSRATGRRYRLPTEAEWEHAALG